MWSIATPTSPRSDIPSITSYKIFLNKKLHVLTTPTSELIKGNGGMIGIELSSKDFEFSNEPPNLSDLSSPYYLTVQSCNDIHDSSHSIEIPIPVAMVTNILPQLSDSSYTTNNGGITSSEVSVMSSGASYTDSNSHSQIDEGIDEGLYMYIHVATCVPNVHVHVLM